MTVICGRACGEVGRARLPRVRVMRLAIYVAGNREIRHLGRCRPEDSRVTVGSRARQVRREGREQMTNHDITCAAGGFLTAIPTCLTVVERPIRRPMASTPASPAWRVETTAPGWFTFSCRSSGQVLVVSGQDGTLVVLAATAEGTRHHWRIIPYPERGSVVIISRMTGLVLTAGSPDGGGSAPVRLAVYHGAAAQHWSFTDPQGGTDAIQSE